MKLRALAATAALVAFALVPSPATAVSDDAVPLKGTIWTTMDAAAPAPAPAAAPAPAGKAPAKKT